MSDDSTQRVSAAFKGGRLSGFFVPAGVLMSIMGASGMGVWAGARFFYGNLEAQITVTMKKQEESDKTIAENARHIAVLEANAINTTANMGEMNRKLDTVIDLLLRRNDRP